MRRIYESNAVSRDDDEPFKPREKKRREHEPQSFRSINSSSWSNRLVPHAIRRRSVSVRVSTPDTEFEQGEPVPFRVYMKNSLPMPLSLKTRSPLLWTWSVDGHREASKLELATPPDEPGQMQFERSEQKRFDKVWDGMVRVSEREWRPVDRGEHTLQVSLNVDDADGANLCDQTTVVIS
ncbi:MAG: hypothetical protein ACI9K3_001131 [Halovenus sp.]|jgi:hypothetical protein